MSPSFAAAINRGTYMYLSGMLTHGWIVTMSFFASKFGWNFKKKQQCVQNVRNLPD